MTRSLFEKIKFFYARRSSKSYIEYLRNKGVHIGNNCFIKSPRHILFDITRPSLLTIGDHVFFHKDMSILTHDWTGWCFVDMYKEFIPSHKKVSIGNNVWFGEGVKVLSGVNIGNNCIIGAYSVVTRSIPDNSVAVGVPCRVVCSIEQFYTKRKKVMIDEAKEYALSIYEKYNRKPLLEDFYDDYPVFVDGSNYNQYNYPYQNIFNSVDWEVWKHNHKAPFDSFESFIDDCFKDSKV